MITINNQTYSGKSVVIRNGKVTIDGIDQTPDSKEITISVNGDIDTLEVDYCKSIKVEGNVKILRSGSGDVDCNDVLGNVQSGSGDIECKNITGDVQTGSGDVKSDSIQGSVRTGSGDIKYKK